jgi:uncharacterized repeat protein (TIGR04138 family)
MHKLNFDDELDKLIARDARYDREAYLFLREALDHTQKLLGRSSTEVRHVSGQQLLVGIRDYALEQFGPMAATVLDDWGVRRCEDFGELVFNLIEQGLLSKTDSDRREDFQGGYDFTDAFRKPFLPGARKNIEKP